MPNKILCIDDDAVTLMLCKLIITRTHLADEIITAKNGKEALDYYTQLSDISCPKNQNDYPNLIFLDLNMPVMGGWEFIEKFTSTFPGKSCTTKVIILSSGIVPEDIEKANKYPFIVDFLSKPLTKEKVNNLKKTITFE